MNPDPIMPRKPWRVGSHYGIHVYEGDRPVATFHTVADARCAVVDHNEAVGRLSEIERLRGLLAGSPEWISRAEAGLIRLRETVERVEAVHRELHPDCESFGPCDWRAALAEEKP